MLHIEVGAGPNFEELYETLLSWNINQVGLGRDVESSQFISKRHANDDLEEENERPLKIILNIPPFTNLILLTQTIFF